MPTDLKIKDPAARLDYAVDWGPLLDGTDGDTIATAAWVDVPEELAVTDEGLSSDGRRHVGYAAGGDHGRAYTVTSRITTAQGREDQLSVRLYVRRQ